MSHGLAELDRVVAASQPADDYAPRPSSSRTETFTQAALAAAASLADLWAPFYEEGWTYNGPQRDRNALTRDFWRGMLMWWYRYGQELHPNQIRLFDPDAFK